LRSVKGSSVYDPTQTTLTVPTAPPTAITNTSLLLNFTNAGIIDGTMDNVLETVGNAQVSTSVVKYGSGSMFFDGTGDYLTVPSSVNLTFGTGDFTVEFWVYLPSASTTQVLFDNRNLGTGIVIFSNSGTLTVNFNNSGGTLITGGVLTSNIWTHIALSRASGSSRLFINGTQSGSTASDSNNYPTNATYIGSNFSGGQTTTGYLDDLRITRGVARYLSNFIPPQVALPRQ
jgi:hypothetical protein